MSFPTYPEYKDSGVEWLGRVPAHWEVDKLKWSTRLITEKSEQRSNPVALENVESWTGRFVETESDFEGDGIAFRSGDVLFGKLRPYLAKVFRATTDGEAIGDFFVLRPTGEFAPTFLRYLLASRDVISLIDGTTFGSKMPRASWETLGSLRVPIPSASEQSAIAAFLDRETAKIDALVAEQERLIELLNEERQAAISHAVTKGLNPDAPMKASGIGRIGDIPATWEMTTIKRFSTLHRGHDLTESERTDGPYPVVTSAGIAGTHARFVSSGPGVVTGRYGSTGDLFFIEDNFWPHNTTLYVSDFHGNLPRFVWYSLQGVDFAAHSAKAAVPGIDRNDLHVLPVAVPPYPEQQAIVSMLDQHTSALDSLVALVADSACFLAERRAALISAAVTGQIDVRGLAPSEAA